MTARNGKPVARLVAHKPIGKRRPDALKGKIVIPDSFFDPLPEDELKGTGRRIAVGLRLDTHAFLWWLTDSRRPSEQACLVMLDEANEVAFDRYGVRLMWQD